MPVLTARLRAVGYVRLMRPRLLIAALTVAATTAVGAASPQSAHAYAHSWSCYRVAYQHCTDWSGQQYNPWVYHRMNLPYWVGVPGTCAKAVTAAGNTKSGSGCDSDNYRESFYASSPTSQAYGYFGDNGCSCNKADIVGYAQT